MVIINLGRDGVVVCRVSWVGQAEVASNGATLGKMNMKNKVTKRTKPCMEHMKEGTRNTRGACMGVRLVEFAVRATASSAY